ncbi:Ig-like domain-containing protein [Isoptericola sp. NPDC057653]|uniref:Ig-like domain-containing protein n=1 Tax=Isoptericola sp. NPDC057653 TaxID=3346195 RepID=UPI00367740EB
MFSTARPSARPTASRRTAAVAALLSATLVVGTAVTASGAPVVGPDAGAPTCTDVADGEVAALALARECERDVRVSVADEPGTSLWAEPGGELRLETTLAATDPSAVDREYADGDVYHSAAANGPTVISPTAPPATVWDRPWAGLCDPAEVTGTNLAGTCAARSTQRLVWTLDGPGILADLEPGDVTRSTLYAQAEQGWLDDVGCTPNVLEMYDLTGVSGAASWAGAPAWTADRRVAQWTRYWRACDAGAAWSGFYQVDATATVKDMVADGRTRATLGLKAGDETCMSCGWNSFDPQLKLTVWFERAPLAPTSLTVANEYGPDLACGAQERWLRGSQARLSAVVADPDDYLDESASRPMTATFQVFAAGAPGTVLWSSTSSYAQDSGSTHSVAVPGSVFQDGQTYGFRVWGTDASGVRGPEATCGFGIDRTAPDAATIRPLLGYDAVYVDDEVRGGAGLTGGFEIRSASPEVDHYVWSTRAESLTTMGKEIPAGRPAVFTYAPSGGGSGLLYAAAVDRAGNVSAPQEYRFLVSWHSDAPTPPPLTVTGPTSTTYGKPVAYTVRLSDDAPQPYGTVTVKRGTTVLASTAVDARTETLTVPGRALPGGSTNLSFTYQAVEGAKVWSTIRAVNVAKLRPTVSAAAKDTPWRHGSTHRLAVSVRAAIGVPTGTVGVYWGGERVGRATLRDGRATVTVAGRALPVGSRTLSVRYSGSATVAAARVTKEVTVRKALSTTSARLADSDVRKPARATLKVAVTSPSSVAPTGKVAVSVDGRVVTTATLRAGDDGHVRVLLPRSVAPGWHKVKAVYRGSGTTWGDASPVRWLRIRPAL